MLKQFILEAQTSQITLLEIDFIREGNVVFRYDTPEKVLEHLLKSGAGTAFYEAVDPSRRQEQEREFISIFRERNRDNKELEVIHEYISCIARKPTNP